MADQEDTHMEHADLRARLVSVENSHLEVKHRLSDLEKKDLSHDRRIDELEKVQADAAVTWARQEERWNQTVKRFEEKISSLEKSFVEKLASFGANLKSINNGLWFVNALIIAGFIISILALIWKGGGHVPMPH
jgi:hypothetical protein